MPYKNPPQCKVNKCEKPVKSNFMCAAHEAKWKRWGDPESPDKRGGVMKHHPVCSFDGCDIAQISLGLCQNHYRSYVAWIDSHKQPRDWRAYGPKNDGKYRRIYVPTHPHCDKNGTVLEHRVVMEQHIGRYLERGETVHHKNGDRRDNRIENLELWSHAQPPGQRVEDKVVFAVEILSLYAPHMLASSEVTG